MSDGNLVNFKFDHGDTAVITRSGETGKVIGRADYKHSKSQSYLIEYQAADGRATEGWFRDDEIALVK